METYGNIGNKPTKPPNFLCLFATSGFQITLWLFNIAIENGPFMDDFPTKTSIYKGFSMAMLNNQMVNMKHLHLNIKTLTS